MEEAIELAGLKQRREKREEIVNILLEGGREDFAAEEIERGVFTEVDEEKKKQWEKKCEEAEEKLGASLLEMAPKNGKRKSLNDKLNISQQNSPKERGGGSKDERVALFEREMHTILVNRMAKHVVALAPKHTYM